MPYFIVILLLFGGAIGYAAGLLLNLKIRPAHAALAGAAGALLGGIGFRLMLAPFGAFIGAILGAAILVAALQILTAPR